MSDEDNNPLIRHWLVLPKAGGMQVPPGSPPRMIGMAEAVPEWERLGYTVVGPYTIEGVPPKLAALLTEFLQEAWLDGNDARALRLKEVLTDDAPRAGHAPTGVTVDEAAALPQQVYDAVYKLLAERHNQGEFSTHLGFSGEWIDEVGNELAARVRDLLGG